MNHDPAALPPSHSRVSLATLMRPNEANLLGNVHGGDTLHTTAQVNWSGTSSMENGVRLEAELYLEPGRLRHVASAYFLMVAIDADGNPRAVPPLLAETPEEVRRMLEAEIRRAHRVARKAEIDQGRAQTS